MSGRGLLLIGWLCVMAVVFQTAPLTRIVYNPQSVQIHDSTAVVYRSFPMDHIGLPRPWLSYVETIRPLTEAHNGGQACTQRGGPFEYAHEGEVGTWSIAWADACLSDPLGYRWASEWTWHVGRMELGPVKLSQTFLRG